MNYITDYWILERRQCEAQTLRSSINHQSGLLRKELAFHHLHYHRFGCHHLGQTERTPLQPQKRLSCAISIKASQQNCAISFYLMLSHAISRCLVLSRAVLRYLMLSYSVSRYLILAISCYSVRRQAQTW